MGTLIKATSDSDTKPNYAVTTSTAAAAAVADGELALFVGDSTGNRLETYNAIVKHVRQAFREAGWPQPAGTGQDLSVIYTVPTQEFSQAALAETDVALIMGFGFTPAHDSGSAHVQRMAELWLEQSKAA